MFQRNLKQLNHTTDPTNQDYWMCEVHRTHLFTEAEYLYSKMEEAI